MTKMGKLWPNYIKNLIFPTGGNELRVKEYVVVFTGST